MILRYLLKKNFNLRYFYMKLLFLLIPASIAYPIFLNSRNTILKNYRVTLWSLVITELYTYSLCSFKLKNLRKTLTTRQGQQQNGFCTLNVVHTFGQQENSMWKPPNRNNMQVNPFEDKTELSQAKYGQKSINFLRLLPHVIILMRIKINITLSSYLLCRQSIHQPFLKNFIPGHIFFLNLCCHLYSFNPPFA